MTHIAQHLILAAGLALGMSSHAAGDHGAKHGSATAAASGAPSGGASANAELTDAEVRKVDKATGKITLKHGEIKNLEMPPMTMVFAVKEPAMLDKVKQGDKVRFRAAGQDGKFTVTEIQAAQ